MEYVGYCRTIPAVIEPTKTTTIKPAATGIGAAVSARAMRPSPCPRELKCSQNAYSADTANRKKKIVLTVIPAMRGIALLNGTP